MNIKLGIKKKLKNDPGAYIVPIFLFSLGVIFITLKQSNNLSAIPGDFGDARFNNLILEHLTRWIIGKDSSLWSPGFFYPYPGTLSFSDNHFGTVIFYALLRALGYAPDYAFIGWYSLSAPLNYFSCFYALRKLGLTAPGSAVGAFIFTFALTVSAQDGHAQLNYRFAIPLAALCWQNFITKGHLSELTKTIGWLTIQFYCSIYLGYFLALLLGTTFVAYWFVNRSTPRISYISAVKASVQPGSLLIIFFCLMALLVLFYPYLYYSRLYGFHRDKAEIYSMLPRIWSYFLADRSKLWHGISSEIPAFPMRHEHQMFFGLAAIILAVVGRISNSSARTRSALISLLLLMLVTLDVHGHSFYYLFMHLPVANAIRSVSRISLAMLFPMAILAGTGYEYFAPSKQNFSFFKSLTGFLLIALALLEYSAFDFANVPITAWRSHQASLWNHVPKELAKNAIIFFPIQEGTPLFMSELDGMSLAQASDRNTLNGYSGNAPAGFYDPGSLPCEQAINRLAGYIAFTKQGDKEFSDLLSRVSIADTNNKCDLTTPLPKHTIFAGPLPSAMISKITLDIARLDLKDGKLVASLIIRNGGNQTLPSISSTREPIRISWRFQKLGTVLIPNDDWNPRRDLPSDVPAHGTLPMQIVVDTPLENGEYRFEASIVQDGVTWFHNAGMPISISQKTVSVVSQKFTSIQ